MYSKILTALSAEDNAVFEAALSIAAATDANLCLLHVLSEHGGDSPISPIPIAWDYETPLSVDAWKNYQKQWNTYAEEGLAFLKEYTSRAEAAGVAAESLQIVGSPGTAICRAAKTQRTDLIVMGSHQRRGIQELMVGSVSNYVMHYAPCSVMMVHLQNSAQEKEIEEYQKGDTMGQFSSLGALFELSA